VINIHVFHLRDNGGWNHPKPSCLTIYNSKDSTRLEYNVLRLSLLGSEESHDHLFLCLAPSGVRLPISSYGKVFPRQVQGSHIGSLCLHSLITLLI
jgi:hypothetical protein